MQVRVRFLAFFARIALTLLCIVLIFRTATLAQESHRFNFSAGAGVSLPAADATTNLNTGWNLDFRGGFNVSRSFLADVDFSFNRWNLSNAALASFGEPGGYGDVWSLTFEPMIRLAPRSPVDVYLLGGTGLYHRGLSLTQPATFNTIYCDPFFGFCYPAVVQGNQVVASFSTYKAGFNAGGGVEVRLGSHALKAFAEARYSDMFTTRGPDLTYVPVTFGLRW